MLLSQLNAFPIDCCWGAGEPRSLAAQESPADSWRKPPALNMLGKRGVREGGGAIHSTTSPDRTLYGDRLRVLN